MTYAAGIMAAASTSVADGALRVVLVGAVVPGRLQLSEQQRRAA
jgi:hypothetical protein